MPNTQDAIYKDSNNQTQVYARRLHERSFLMFEYYGSDSQVTRAHMPFLQNINITEVGKANLASYNLLGRAGQLFSYGGADSRKLSLEFELNALHLFHLQQTEGLTDRLMRTIKNTDKEQDRRSFFEPSNKFKYGSQGTPFDYSANAVSELKRFFGEQTINELSSKLKSVDRHRAEPGTDPKVDLFLDNTFEGPVTSGDVFKSLNLIMYWVNLVRSSTLNNSKNTVYGPPIVRLNHGPMYMNSPCLVEDYKITIDKGSNYDVETLIPYSLKFSMSLIESRAGNFGDYQSGDLGNGDNLTGWESIIDSNVLDSMNYFVDFDKG